MALTYDAKRCICRVPTRGHQLQTSCKILALWVGGLHNETNRGVTVLYCQPLSPQRQKVTGKKVPGEDPPVASRTPVTYFGVWGPLLFQVSKLDRSGNRSQRGPAGSSKRPASHSVLSLSLIPPTYPSQVLQNNCWANEYFCHIICTIC